MATPAVWDPSRVFPAHPLRQNGGASKATGSARLTDCPPPSPNATTTAPTTPMDTALPVPKKHNKLYRLFHFHRHEERHSSSSLVHSLASEDCTSTSPACRASPHLSPSRAEA